ncbi:hypothetical protein IAT38_005207 [Cryptococcus sp. DSM 104549]
MSDDEDIWGILDNADAVPAPRPQPQEDTFDDDLRRAIALSEAEARAPKRPRREETPEEERRMLEEALAASLAESDPSSSHHPASPGRPPAKRPRPSAPSPPLAHEPIATISDEPVVLKIGGQTIDRAQMERERRERQAARAASAGQATKDVAGSSAAAGSGSKPSASSSGAGSKIASFSDLRHASSSLPPAPLAARPAMGPSSVSGLRAAPQSGAGSHPYQGSGPFPRDAAGEYYLDGELRHTGLDIGTRNSDPTFSIKEIIGKHSEISLIILSSFVVDDQWIEEKNILPDPADAPVIIIRPHPREKEDWGGRVQLQVNGEVWCYPKMEEAWGTMHMKFFWIFYKTGRLRIAVSTANMVAYDYNQIENSVFVQDFMPLPQPIPELREDYLQHDLPIQFRYLFEHTRVNYAIKHHVKNHPLGSKIPFTHENDFADLKKYDWSRVRCKVVMSVSGVYQGFEEIEQFGMCRLGQLLREEKWMPQEGERVVAEYQGSSLGQYSLGWFDTFYSFLGGSSVRTLASRPKPTAWPPLKILFPSLRTVDASVLGRDGGGTMFAGKGWNTATKPLFHDSNSKRGGVLMHSKVLVALFEPESRALGFETVSVKRKAQDEDEENDSAVGGWVYIGSHNFSPAAWGTVDVKKNTPTLRVRNYELGIVLPLDRKNARAAADKIAPYKRPAAKYSATDVPWDQKLHGIGA